MKKVLFILPILVLATVLLAGCSKDSENITCTEEQKAAEICTADYTPVCGNDNVTYGNACAACSSKSIEWYKMGECNASCGEEDETCQAPELE